MSNYTVVSSCITSNIVGTVCLAIDTHFYTHRHIYVYIYGVLIGYRGYSTYVWGDVCAVYSVLDFAD